jgi:ATP-dependent DNA helicase RecQ
MSDSPTQILQKYWGYSRFRALQEDIIQSVLDGNDTLALLPTGGGKSICFQVPALIREGVCIVVSPLIALMKDQVENLRKRNIRATAIYSGMSRDEVSIALDNCLYGDYKFLYLSPERLLSETVCDYISKMKVSIWAIDEAHCISQWGYDFRPPYLQISEIRELHPSVPVLALTATATPEVRDDIMNRLGFKRHCFFQKSFERKNLSYLVYHSEDKQSRLLEILSGVPGTGIVYVRNRKRTREYAEFLKSRNISADFYHAGLTSQLRDQRQDDWKSGKTRVMVCTNAFGMGIDKPDVRVVVHMDLPDTLEAYYQEAGRAGRDEKAAFAVVLYNKGDIQELVARQKTSFPPIAEIKTIYQALANYLQVPVDAGMGVSYDFEITRFIANYNLHPLTAMAAMKLLENEGLIALSDQVFLPSRIHIRISNQELYEFQVKNPKYDLLIKSVLRSSAGVFDDFVKISEPELATRNKLTYDEVVAMLKFMSRTGIIDYEPRKDVPQVTFLTPREDVNYLSLNTVKYRERKERFIKKSEAVKSYILSNHLCRSQILLGYFGENSAVRCGSCDYCRKLNKIGLNEMEISAISEIIMNELAKGPAALEHLIKIIKKGNKPLVLELIQWMIDQGNVIYNPEGKLQKVN